MFNSIFIDHTLTVESVLISLLTAVALGFLLAFVYTRRNRTTRSFASTLALLPLVTATVIMAVNGNLGAGIAVAGSFSLIRFRSVQGTGQEILAVFLAAALGLCLGAGYLAVACLLLVLFLATALLLGTVRFGSAEEREKELRVTVPESLDYDGLLNDLLDRTFTSWELLRVRTVDMGTAFQLIYRVAPGPTEPGKSFLDEIRERNGNLPVSLGKVPESRNEM